MAQETYVVQQGDNLTYISNKFGTPIDTLVKWNNLKDPDLIYSGQKLIVKGGDEGNSSGGASGTTTVKKNVSQQAKINTIAIQNGTTRKVFATWDWDKSNTDHYETRWWYATGDGVGFIGNEGTTTHQHSTYDAPENATHVTFYVRPVSKTHKSSDGKSEVKYWTAQWSTKVSYYLKDAPPSTPPVPTVTLDGFKLTAELDNLDVNGSYIELQVFRDNKSIFSEGIAKITARHISWSCNVDPGSEYKVRCRALKNIGASHSDWSDFTDNYSTIPMATTILDLRALSETSIYVEWFKISGATEYEVEYAFKKSRFDSSSETTKTTVSSVVRHTEIDGLESGREYFFRVRAVNDQGPAIDWSEIKSVKIGTAPAPPTTWSSKSTAIVGEDVMMYWIHNTEDGSKETYAQLEITINDDTNTYTIQNTTKEDEEVETSRYRLVLNSSTFREGAKIRWRVRTRGIMEKYSDWSVVRTIDVYAPPTLELNVTDKNGANVDLLGSFPFYISGTAGPHTQTPIGYHVSIISNDTYETVDNMGNPTIVNQGDEVYSKFFDTSDPLLVEMSASNVSLENNVVYTAKVVVSMNSGLTAEETRNFMVGWILVDYWPNAEIWYDPTTYSTSVRPYCVDINEQLIDGLLMSVYRREFDGSFTELIKDVDNVKGTFVTDPHPALDFARYRIVAKSASTGVVSYYDVPGYPIGESSIIIQWNEQWSTFEVTEEAPFDQPTWSGSLLKLPYNVDVSNNPTPDVSLIEYIGREHPVSYYGTHLGETATWTAEISKSDKETLYALRRLAVWMGDVYVREPSGSGYWANITVSFSQKHCEVTIPVTLNVARVSGGV